MTKTAQISDDQMIFSVQELKDKGRGHYLSWEKYDGGADE